MIGKADGLALSRVQYDRFADLLDTLDADDWSKPTDCAGWTVKDVAGHVLGGIEAMRSTREFLRVLRLARREDAALLDALNAVQVREKRAVPGPEIAARLRRLTPSALRKRRWTPPLLRALVRPRLDVAGRVSLGWIQDVVYSRDVLVHRVDVCRATGRDLVLDESERRIVADVVEEWCDRHGKPVALHLTGPAGGTYVRGRGDVIECDAVEFTRQVSGRGEPPLATRVQF